MRHLLLHSQLTDEGTETQGGNNLFEAIYSVNGKIQGSV